jgi:hypothetical protein
MRSKFLFLKRIWIFSFLYRIYFASSYFNKKYWQILKWGFTSNESNNFTYDLSEDNILYLAHTVAVALNKTPEEIKKYIDELNNDLELKDHITKVTANSSLKKFADKEIHFAKRLGWYAFARAMKPKFIVETGVDKGLGSVVLCSALLRNKAEGFAGRFIGTDINPKAGYLLTGKYAEVGEIMYGDSIQSLKTLSNKIDLFINDSDHSAEYEYQEYKIIKDKISDEAIILGDNAHVTDKLALFSLEEKRNFIFFKENPKNHWYPGAGIGISFKGRKL